MTAYNFVIATKFAPAVQVSLSSSCSFYFKRAYATHPAQLVAASVGLALIVGLSSTLAIQHRQLGLAQNDKKMLSRSHPVATAPVQKSVSGISLPQLRSSTVVKSFNSIASDVHVPLDEAAYALEGTDRAPYLQYRITVTTKAGYGEIRKFLAVLSSEMPNATLDSIHCSRSNVMESALGCELAFSAFFAKPDHG